MGQKGQIDTYFNDIKEGFLIHNISVIRSVKALAWQRSNYGKRELLKNIYKYYHNSRDCQKTERLL
jgi:hypothetical protein